MIWVTGNRKYGNPLPCLQPKWKKNETRKCLHHFVPVSRMSRQPCFIFIQLIFRAGHAEEFRGREADKKIFTQQIDYPKKLEHWICIILTRLNAWFYFDELSSLYGIQYYQELRASSYPLIIGVAFLGLPQDLGLKKTAWHTYLVKLEVIKLLQNKNKCSSTEEYCKKLKSFGRI